MKDINKIKDLIGNTKLHLATKIMNHYNLKSNIYLKLEKDNYSGSSKDRLAYFIIKNGIDKGLIDDDTILIEATSGNTGISMAAIANLLNLKCIIVLPSNMSEERTKMIKDYHAEIVYTDASLGMAGAIKEAERLKTIYPKTFSLNQFDNPIGSLAHYKTTGPEIYNDLKGNVDFFVAGIGTGTTFSGTARYLKEQNKSIQCIGVEPFESNVLNGGKKGSHKIEGIGAGFIPSVLESNLIDQVCDVKSTDAYNMCHMLYKIENLKCGISSGAALCAAIEIAKNNDAKNIVVIMPDDGNRYISKGVFDDGFKIN